MLIKETGAGLTNSNSYTDVSAADAYYLDRENATWAAATSTAKAAALIRATDYLDASYIFRSVRATDTQALENPRHCETTINAKVIKATIELARFALSQDLFAAVTTRDVVEKEVEAGSVKTRTKFEENKISDPYPAITKILKGVADRRGASASCTMMSL